ncbi:MAG: hypothetical protein Fur0039_15380 [Rhodocyclaceae bacterium]
MDYMEQARRLADALDDGGEYFEVGGQVVYGWRVTSAGPFPTSEAAELLLIMADEIERLRSASHPGSRRRTSGDPPRSARRS